MPAARELIAHGREVDEICQEIGADWLIYQDLEDLVLTGKDGNAEVVRYEDSVFSGKYITGDPAEDYLQDLELERNDSALVKRMQSGE